MGQFDIQGDHLEVLKWLRANGCPWDRSTLIAASGDLLEWAVANGVPETDENARLTELVDELR